MATIPTPADVRTQLEGYNVTAAIVSDTWITNHISEIVIPYINRIMNTDIQVAQSVTEYHNGNGQTLLFLNRRMVTAVTDIQIVRGEPFLTRIDLGSVELIPNEGILKAKKNLNEGLYFTIFPKGELNIKVTYTHGGVVLTDHATAIKLLAACGVLTEIEGRTGGGDLTVQAFGRAYGNMGKYTHVRKQWNNQAMMLMRKYMTSVTGA